MGVEDEEEDQEYSVNRMVDDNLPPAVTMKILRKSMREEKIMQQLMLDVEKYRMSKGSHCN